MLLAKSCVLNLEPCSQIDSGVPRNLSATIMMISLVEIRSLRKQGSVRTGKLVKSFQYSYIQ